MAKKLKTYEDLTEAAKEDIVVLYRGCKDQREQIKICAELNQTTPGVIRCVLEEAGMKVPPYPGRKVAPVKQEPAEATKEKERAAIIDYRSPFARVEGLIASCRHGDSRDVRATYRMLALQLCEQVVNELFGGDEE